MAFWVLISAICVFAAARRERRVLISSGGAGESEELTEVFFSIPVRGFLEVRVGTEGDGEGERERFLVMGAERIGVEKEVVVGREQERLRRFRTDMMSTLGKQIFASA